MTSGSGGVVQAYETADWIRAIRHGLAADGQPLLMMPSHEYFPLSDTDIADLIAYLTLLEPVDRASEEIRLGPLAYAFIGLGVLELPFDQVEDHERRPTPPEPGPTAAYGAYLAVTCTGCHGLDMAGGSTPGAPVPAANLTLHEDGLADWTLEDLRASLRTGRGPSGRAVGEHMPWELYSVFTDEEIEAVWAHLEALPAKAGP